jgi:hypothetical protein
MAVDVDVLDCRFDCAHEQQFLVLIYGSFTELGNCHTPHICTRQILVSKDELHMVCFVSLLVGLKRISRLDAVYWKSVPRPQSLACDCGNRTLLRFSLI